MLGISSEATIKVYTWICLGFRIPLEFFFLGATIKVYAGISSAATIKVYTYNLRKKGGSGPSIPIILEKKGGSGPPGPPPLDPPMIPVINFTWSSSTPSTNQISTFTESFDDVIDSVAMETNFSGYIPI